MPDLPSLPDLVAVIMSAGGNGESDADPLARISAAEKVAGDLNRLGDRLIGYSVERARAEGHSWSDIGAHLGVTRQAAQQRYTPRRAGLTLADLTAAGALTRLTPRTRQVLDRSEAHARRLRHRPIGPGHLLLALLDDTETLAIKAIQAMKATPAGLRRDVERQLPPPGDSDDPVLPIGLPTRRVLDAALDEALALGHNYLGTEHLLLGMLHDRDSMPYTVLAEHGIVLEPARNTVRALIDEILRARS